MPAAQRNFIVEQGADWLRSVQLLQSPGGPALDLTGCSAQLLARDSAGGNILLADLSVGEGVTIDALNGAITLALSASQTAAIATAGLNTRTVSECLGQGADGAPLSVTRSGPCGVYDLSLSYADGSIAYLLTGYFLIWPRV